MEPHVRAVLQAAPCNVQRLWRRVDAMEQSDPWRDENRPAPRSTPEIKSFSVYRQRFEGKAREIAREEPLLLIRIQFGLIKRSPFGTEAPDSLLVDILQPWSVSHRRLPK
jgi:hypothetical protein